LRHVAGQLGLRQIAIVLAWQWPFSLQSPLTIAANVITRRNTNSHESQNEKTEKALPAYPKLVMFKLTSSDSHDERDSQFG
jgi:hypothetical protein